MSISADGLVFSIWQNEFRQGCKNLENEELYSQKWIDLISRMIYLRKTEAIPAGFIDKNLPRGLTSNTPEAIEREGLAGFMRFQSLMNEYL